MPDSKPQLSMLVTLNEDDRSGYMTVTAELVSVVDGLVRGLNYGELSEYADLGVFAQTDEGSTKTGGRFYGWKIEYRSPYTVDLKRAEQMVKVLSRIEKRMTDLNEMAGQPPEFVSYLLRIATILKIRSFAKMVKSASTYSESTIGWMNADQVRWYIEEAEAAYIKKHSTSEAMSA